MTTKTKKAQKVKAPKLKGFKIKANPLSEDQIKVFVEHFDKYKSFPGSKIPCSVTGKLTTCVGPWLKKKIKEFGSAEKLLRNYTCRAANKESGIKSIGSKKKLKKNGLTKDENERYDIPLIKFTPSRPMTEAELSKDSETICLRPDIFLNNGRHCDGCHYYHLCRSRLKTLPKDIRFDGEQFVYEDKKSKKK